MGLTLKHIVLATAGTFHYRRRIPKDAAVVIGRGEFKRLLGQTEREALRNFPRVNAEYERMVLEARSCEEAHNRPLINVIRENSISADTSYAAGPSTIEPVVNIHRVSQPSPTLAEAKRLYLRERIKGDINEKQKTLRLERIMGYVAHGIELDRPLTHLNREDAREVRDHMLRDLEMNPSTVRRYMNDIRAVIGFGITEFGLRGALNPFQRLEIRVQTVASEERSPIPDKTLKSIRARLEGHAGDDLWQIWRILEGTGCRLGEITGLLVSDLHLDNSIPCD